MKKDTLIVTAGRRGAREAGVVNPPVYHVSTVLRPTLKARWEAQAARARGEPGFYYGRSGSPTARAFEEAVAALEGGHDCASFPSGLAAIAAALMGCLSAGDHLLMTDGCYGPVRTLCDGMLKRLGVETTYYDPLATGDDVARLMRPNTRLVYVEAPSSFTFEVQDLPAIAAAAHAGGAWVMADNTWATGVFYRPLALGADIVAIAGTKYLGGHSDVMLGAVAATEAAWPVVRRAAGALGQCAGPDDLYLGHRGLRTLGVRLRRHHDSGLAVARWLSERPEVARVLHPGLESCPGHAVWARDFEGASGLFSIVMAPCSEAQLFAFADHLEHFGIGASWGGYECLLLAERTERAFGPWRGEDWVVRLHIGLEDVDDIIADLAQGFERMK